jgi:hypothetical protein
LTEFAKGNENGGGKVSQLCGSPQNRHLLPAWSVAAFLLLCCLLSLSHLTLSLCLASLSADYQNAQRKLAAIDTEIGEIETSLKRRKIDRVCPPCLPTRTPSLFLLSILFSSRW